MRPRSGTGAVAGPFSLPPSLLRQAGRSLYDLIRGFRLAVCHWVTPRELQQTAVSSYVCVCVRVLEAAVKKM